MTTAAAPPTLNPASPGRWSRHARTAMIAAVAAVAVLALALRLVHLGRESIWFDEGASVKLASLSLGAMFREAARTDFTPPLYYTLLHVWIALFGKSEAAVRMPSALLGAAAVPVVYAVGALLFGRRTGLLAALLLALSPFHLRYAQEARCYTLLALSALGSMYFFLRLLRGDGSPARPGKPQPAAWPEPDGEVRPLLFGSPAWILGGYLATSLLCLYSHVHGAFILAAQNVYLLLTLALRQPPGLRAGRWLILQGAMAVCALPIAALVLARAAGTPAAYWWIPRPGIGALKAAFNEFAGSWLLGALFAALAIVAGIAVRRLRGRYAWRHGLPSLEGVLWEVRLSDLARWLLLGTWLAIPAILPFLVSLVAKPMFVTRYLIAASPALLLLAARGLDIGLRRPLRGVLLTALAAVLSLLAMGRYYQTHTREPWQQVTAMIESKATTQDVLVFNEAAALTDTFNYYARRTDLTKRSVEELVDEPYARKLAGELESYPRIWLILCHSSDPNRLVIQHLADKYRVVSDDDYRGIGVVLLARKAGG